MIFSFLVLQSVFTVKSLLEFSLFPEALDEEGETFLYIITRYGTDLVLFVQVSIQGDRQVIKSHGASIRNIICQA